ncbi:alpha/beta hydrolase [Sporosarcina thermotolerans]|uniref:Alpha/beta hydrolase n=1 Tax=Sporosarcina thermotolerans TaxID=633404 RepID=A0AAW9A9Z3_9BACL|nr:alpha/beta fold hydrolase [Sporosarcina thermotolerans]MDW0118287.1 alpha/beta hydrolase [Sporosarcina thermotolerans]WHT48599.1 alpha/beta hydrolase [Sporosarcina thermotolerans]
MKRISLTFCLLISAILLVTGCSKKEKELDSLGAIEGVWNGTINIPNQPLLVSLTFTKENGTISIPSQGLQNFPLAGVTLNGSELVIQMTLPGQQITFDGSVEKNKISGTFTQQGQSFPFELTKGSSEETPDTGEAVQIDLNEGKMTGVLEVPKGDGPFPLMVIIAGSGPTDHNGNSPLIPGKNNSLKMLAEQLADEGVASIRYDKRGVGVNQSLVGNEEDLLFDDFINDAAAWVEFAKNDSRFSKVGIIGHSEGSLLGMVAAEKTDADAFISIAGAGRSIDQVLLEQLGPQLPVNLLKESDDILQKLKQGEQVEKFSAELQSLFRPSVQPYMISWLKYDPVKELQKLSSPVLIINGTRDFQVPVGDAERLHEGKKDSRLAIIKNMNHILKEAPEDQEGNMATYMDPNLPLAKGLMDEIIDFLK